MQATTLPRPRLALASLSLSMLMSSLDTSIANSALPALAAAFQAPFQAVQWIVLAYLLSLTALIVAAGRLGDIFGRRRLLLAGITVFTAASALCGLAPALGILIAARAVQGAGAAIMMSLSMASLGSIVPQGKTGAIMGWLGTMSALGTTLGPSLGGLLLGGFGWRAVFLVNVPLGLLNLFLAARHLPSSQRPPNAPRPAIHLMGVLLLTLSLAAYALAMTAGRGALLLLALSAAALALFLRAEATAPSPLIHLALFRALRAPLAMSALVATVVMTTFVVGPFYLSRALSLPPARVGLVLSFGPFTAALAGVPAGWLVDRFGTARMTLAALIAVFSGCAALSLSPIEWGVPGYAAPIVVLTAGYALFQAANNTAVMAAIDSAQHGVASATLGLSRNLGLITGAAAMGAIFAHSSAAFGIAAGLHAAFSVAAALIAAAIGIHFRGRPALTPAMAKTPARSRYTAGSIDLPAPAHPPATAPMSAATASLADDSGSRKLASPSPSTAPGSSRRIPSSTAP